MDAKATIDVPTDLYINGEFVEAASGERFDVINPATEEVLASVASAGIEDAMKALDAAHAAFPAWAAKKPRERAEILRKAFELIMADQERLARLITLENGKAPAEEFAAKSPMPPNSSAGTRKKRCAILATSAMRLRAAHASSCTPSPWASACS